MCTRVVAVFGLRLWLGVCLLLLCVAVVVVVVVVCVDWFMLCAGVCGCWLFVVVTCLLLLLCAGLVLSDVDGVCLWCIYGWC